jgi:hypothetical protein
LAALVAYDVLIGVNVMANELRMDDRDLFGHPLGRVGSVPLDETDAKAHQNKPCVDGKHQRKRNNTVPPLGLFALVCAGERDASNNARDEA